MGNEILLEMGMNALREEILQYELWTSLVYAIAGILPAVALIVFLAWAFRPKEKTIIVKSTTGTKMEKKLRKRWYDEHQDLTLGIALGGVFLAALSFAAAFGEIMDLVTYIAFPEHLVVEYMTKWM